MGYLTCSTTHPWSMRVKFALLLSLIFTACSPPPTPPEVWLMEELIDYFNEQLPEELPEFHPANSGASIYLAGQTGKRSFLLNPGTIDRSRFQDDTLDTGRKWDYLLFHDKHQVSYNYAASEYSPADSSRFGASARVLEISTPALYAADNPEDSALGYIAVALHEMAHMTEDYPYPPDLPDMMDQMQAYETDTLLQQSITAENVLLLAVLGTKDKLARSTLLKEYLTLKAERTAGQDALTTLAENYYEFNEGYGRFVEHLVQQSAGNFSNDYLTEFFGPIPNYDLNTKEWMWQNKYNDYFYVLGFNKYRILAQADDYAFVKSIRGKSELLLDDYLWRLVE